LGIQENLTCKIELVRGGCGKPAWKISETSSAAKKDGVKSSPSSAVARTTERISKRTMKTRTHSRRRHRIGERRDNSPRVISIELP